MPVATGGQQRELLRECAFCNELFAVPPPPRHMRRSCDACRTHTAVQARSDARRAEQVAAYKRKWIDENRDKHRAYARATYYRRRDAVLASAAAYRVANKERIAAYQKAYRAERPPAVLAAELRRAARRRGAAGRASMAQINARFEFYGNRCAYCGGPAESIDHVIPLAQGGTHWPANLRPACLSCNGSKRHKPLAEWLVARHQWAASAA